MIQTKNELIKFIKDSIFTSTGKKVKLELMTNGYKEMFTSGNGMHYFGYEILVENELRISICFEAGYAKRDYFKEGYILDEHEVLFLLEDIIEEIKEYFENKETL